MTDDEARRALRPLVTGFMPTRMLYLAVELGLPDLLAAGPRTAEELARTTGSHAPSLARLLRALAAHGVFADDGEGRFAATPLSAQLRRDRPDSLRPWVLDFAAPYVQAAWMALGEGVRTGAPPFAAVHGMSFWEYHRTHPEVGRNFNEFLEKGRPHQCDAVARAYDFSSIATLVDVGGGHGQFLTAILRANPALHGILFDAPSVVPGAEAAVRAAGVVDRCHVVAGDFFVAVPEADACILEHVIHDWSDEDSIRILATCRQALRVGGRVLLVEQLLSPAATAIDMHMLVLFGEARQRTEREFQALFEAAGLRLARVVPTDTEVSILEGVAG